MPAKEPNQAAQRFSIELNRLGSGKRQGEPRSSGLTRHAQSWLLPASALLGTIFGASAAWQVVNLDLAAVFLQSSWPKQGLILYTNHPNAQILVEDSAGKRFSAGQLGPDGTICLRDLAPGRYRVQVGAPGCQSVVQFVPIEHNRPTVLGFPEKIDLPRISLEPTSDRS